MLPANSEVSKYVFQNVNIILKEFSNGASQKGLLFLMAKNYLCGDEKRALLYNLVVPPLFPRSRFIANTDKKSLFVFCFLLLTAA